MMIIDVNVDDDVDDCTTKNDDICQVGDGLRQHYTKTLRPFEEAHNFHTLHSPPLEVEMMMMMITLRIMTMRMTGTTMMMMMMTMAATTRMMMRMMMMTMMMVTMRMRMGMRMGIMMILQDADFTGKPSVLLVGQYSTGKTTLIRF